MAQGNAVGFLRGIIRSKAGNVFPIMAFGLIVLAGLVGGGVDASRAFLVKNRLQNACDAGVLAGRHAVLTNGFDTAAQNAARNYFDVNFRDEPGTSNTLFTPVSPDTGNTVNATASTQISATVMKLFGFQTMALNATCTATMSVGNSDVVMVLDTTGSMAFDLDSTHTRIVSLRTAMKNFYDTVAAATLGSNARVRYGFVPYNQTVNVGYLLNSNWLVDSWAIQSKEAQTHDQVRVTDEVESYKAPVYSNDTSTGNFINSAWVDYEGSWKNSNKCEDNLANNTAWTNVGTATSSSNTYIDDNDWRITQSVTTQPQSRVVYECYKQSKNNYWIETRQEHRDSNTISLAKEEPIYKTETVKVFDKYLYKRVTYDVSGYKAGNAVSTVTGPSGGTESSTWAGCIEERSSVASGAISFSALGGMSPSNMYDIDIDSTPTGSDSTKWRPLWPEVAYVRTTSSSNNYVTNNATSLYGAAVGASCPKSAQLLTSMTKAAFYAYADALTPNGGTYHDIGMVWGARLSSPTGIFSSNVNMAPTNGGSVARHIIFMTDGTMDTDLAGQSAWGVEWHDRRVTTDGYSNQDDRHNQRLLAVCSAAKAKGIRVWVIAVSTSLTTQLESCASSESAFTARNATQLNAAFQEIAKNVGELRVTQ